MRRLGLAIRDLADVLAETAESWRACRDMRAVGRRIPLCQRPDGLTVALCAARVTLLRTEQARRQWRLVRSGRPEAMPEREGRADLPARRIGSGQPWMARPDRRWPIGQETLVPRTG
jgi:hypothetical protein